MAKRNIHYEQAFEQYLRRREIAYIAVNENKRPIISGQTIKNFDFLVSASPGRNLIVDIKGKKFPYKTKGGLRYWENWVELDDVLGLAFWSKYLGEDFHPFIVYVYWLQSLDDEAIPAKKFADRVVFKDRAYAVVGVELECFTRYGVARSPKWRVVGIPAEKFQEVIVPFRNVFKACH